MRRTIAEARHILETSIRPTANAFTEERARAVLEAAESKAKTVAGDYADRQAEAVASAIRDQQRELTEVRDGYEELGRDADSVTAAEYSRRLADLRGRETRATAALARLEERAASVAEVEEHAIEWYDRITPPMARTEFPF